VEGKVVKKELCVTNYSSSTGTNLDNLRYTVNLGTNSLTLHPETISIDEFRTASQPLYTEDFNPI
jgi:hypothetical protein